MVICLERVADLHMAQLMPLPLTVSCFSKIQIGFTFLVPAYPGSPGKGPVNGCVCVCVLAAFDLQIAAWLSMICTQDDIDLVTTDVLASLMLLGQEESQRRSNVVRLGTQSQDSAISPPRWMNVPRAKHYMCFALAAYGWPWYILPSKQLLPSLWRIYHISRCAAHRVTDRKHG